MSNVDGESNYVRIQVLTNAGALDRAKQLAVVERLTDIAADAAGDPTLSSRTWVLLTEAPDGGWGLTGHANTNEELVAAARARLRAYRPAGPSRRAIMRPAASGRLPLSLPPLVPTCPPGGLRHRHDIRW